MNALRLLMLLPIVIGFELTSAVRTPPLPQTPRMEQKPQANPAMPQLPFADRIRRTITFITVIYPTSAGVVRTLGTGFFVKLDDNHLGGDESFVYLVTNRHVVQPGINLGTPREPTEVRVRLNLKNPQGNTVSADHVISLRGVHHWYFPDDDSVDLAVVPIGPEYDIYDFLVVSSGLFATQEQIKSWSVGIGDQVIFSGFFSSFSGQRRLEPIVRQGILAMIPAEPITTTLRKQGHLYLADVHAFQGNSGSPAFVSVAGVRHGSVLVGEEFLLIGIISGYFPESAGSTAPVAPSILTGEVHDNSGIATVVPAGELMKLLMRPDLQALRDEEVARITKRL
jgi:hypothetical protein